MLHSNSLDPITEKNVQRWLEGNYDEATKAYIRELLQTNPSEIIDSFHTTLSFGTGGLRGLMGVGSNRINLYTVKAAAQGLANYLKKQRTSPLSVFIGYDSRSHSRDFAHAAAQVLAGNQIWVYLSRELRPVPLVSFGSLHKKCAAGIMITASHNPPNYNGFKIFWNDGAQLLPPHDKGILEEIRLITDPSQVHESSLESEMISFVNEEIDREYLVAMQKLQHYPCENQRHGHELKIVYSNLHGTGVTLIPQLLANWGFTQLTHVEEQRVPDGHFPTVATPNPEEKNTLALGIEKLLKTEGDLLLATDPDADRLGVATLHRAIPVILTGNEIACLCLEHICQALSSQHRLPTKGAFVKTIVTTELFRKIAEHYQTTCIDVLTGFRYIAELIRQWEKEEDGLQYIFGAEESFGYLLGTKLRDKDAVLASALVCEVALQGKKVGKDLVDLLHDIYRKYGIFREKMITLNFKESQSGQKKIVKTMEKLRLNPPKSVSQVPVITIEDYLQSKNRLPKSNMLLFWLADGTKLVVRPSGTEPKIKLYGGVVKSHCEEIENGIAQCDARLDLVLNAMQKYLTHL